MAISKKIQDAVNKQINAEFYSAYLYLSMSAYFESINLAGFAKWMIAQTQEEMFHAMKFFNHVVDRGGKVILDKIEKPKIEWSSALEVFENAYEHEQKVTKLINDLIELAQTEKDFAIAGLLQWFADEQVEEESTSDDVVQKIKMVDTEPGGLFLLDKELGTRVFTPPPVKGE